MALPFIALLVLTLVAASTDVRSGLIPNWLTLPVVLVAPAAQLVLGGSSALLSSLLGGLACGVVPACLFRAGAMGGGDVKLLVAIGVLAGPLIGLEVQLIAYNVLVAFAVVVLARRGQLVAVLRRSLDLLIRRGEARATSEPEALENFRLGAPIFVAAVARLALEVTR